MKPITVYLKIDQNIEIQKTKVYVEDIAKVYTVDPVLKKALNRQVVTVINSKNDCKLCYSVMKIIELFTKEHPGITVVNLGESEFIITYLVPRKPNKIMEYSKVLVVGTIIFFGGAFSIMTFNEDASVLSIFDMLYKMVLGTAEARWSILEIGYSLGIALGVVIFFNHFSRFPVSEDPTPIQIEMRKYENDINSTVIQNASREGTTKDVD